MAEKKLQMEKIGAGDCHFSHTHTPAMMAHFCPPELLPVTVWNLAMAHSDDFGVRGTLHRTTDRATNSQYVRKLAECKTFTGIYKVDERLGIGGA